MAESGQYDYNTILRRQKIAEQMLAESSKPQKIEHWAQGLAQLGNIGADTFRLNQLEKQGADARRQDTAALMGVLGGGAGAPSAAPSIPAPALPAAPSAPAPSGDVSDRIISAESGGNATAKNPMSSAAGAGQFINSTWLDTIKRARPDLAAGKDDAALLALRSDPALSKDMTDAYATQNRSILGNAGLPTTPGATYLAHFAGPSGAQKVLSADPKMRVAELLDPQAMKANPFLANMTAGDLRGWADRKMGGSPAAPLAPPPKVIGEGGGSALRDAQGDYGPDAIMPPPGAPAAPAGPAAVAQAMTPGGAAPPAAPARTNAGPGGIPENKRADIARLLNTTPGSPAHTMGMAILQKTVTGEKEAFEPLVDVQKRAAAGIPPEDKTPYQIDRNTGKIAPMNTAPTTNVALNTALKGKEAMATEVVKDFGNVNTAAREAVKRSAVWDEMEKAAGGFTPGATADIKLQAKRYLKDLGLIQGEDVPDAEVFKMMQQQIAIHSQPKGQGAVSNSERELFAKAIPNITMSPEALTRAIATSRKLDEYDRKVAQIYRDSARKNDGVPNGVDVNDEIEKLGSPLSTADTRWLTQGAKAAPTGGAAAAPAATGAAAPAPIKVASPEEARKLPKGTSIILPDGSQGVVP